MPRRRELQAEDLASALRHLDEEFEAGERLANEQTWHAADRDLHAMLPEASQGGAEETTWEGGRGAALRGAGGPGSDAEAASRRAGRCRSA
ncbi:hypothetical protein HRG_012948 [Hirsutella rhossiliensis]